MNKKTDYAVYLPGLKKEELARIKKAAALDSRAIRTFVKVSAIDAADRILAEKR